jgi:hypothetical protein
MNLNDEFHLESSNCDPGVELRLRRDREREDLRKMIAQKRKEKNLRFKKKEAVEISVGKCSFLDLEDEDEDDRAERDGRTKRPSVAAAAETDPISRSDEISGMEESFSKSSFFKYSQDDINVNRRTMQSSDSLSAAVASTTETVDRTEAEESTERVMAVEPVAVAAATMGPQSEQPVGGETSAQENHSPTADVLLDSSGTHSFQEEDLLLALPLPVTVAAVDEKKPSDDSFDPLLTLSEDDESEDLEYDNLIQAMKLVLDSAGPVNDDNEEFEEEEEDEDDDEEELEDIDEAGEDYSSESFSPSPQFDENEDTVESESQHLSPDDILSRAEQLFTEIPRPLNAAAAYDDQKEEEELSNGSWDEFSDHDSPEDPDNALAGVTVFGVPFPLGQTVCKENGMNPELSTPASRMEALREYLENSLGTDRFIKVYRLLKSVGPKDDDDELLSALEKVVGVEGLRYMDTFFQLIHIEDKFESGEW